MQSYTALDCWLTVGEKTYCVDTDKRTIHALKRQNQNRFVIIFLTKLELFTILPSQANLSAAIVAVNFE